MNIQATTKNAFALIFFLSFSAGFICAQETRSGDALPVERYALYVASNNGGADCVTLKYAETDANRLARTMAEIGGVKQGNSIILDHPTRDEINAAFRTMNSLIEKNESKAKRTEFLFYYSGHSDEKAFLIGPSRYSYSDLKNEIDAVHADVHVVMLDSCYSGNFVRAKGGSRQKPFLMDDSTVVQGHAYLSSSSGFETSQESDKIQASYFTQALITGLRGAADSSGDGKVSLNELYHYAFNKTLSETELSSTGPQHPSYDITLVGSGDLILTDISDAESVLTIASGYEGKFFIRDGNGLLVSELNKIRGTQIAIALPAGSYVVTIIEGTSTTQGTILLGKGQRFALDEGKFRPVQKLYGRSRGEDETGGENDGINAETPETLKWKPFSISLVPGITFPANAENVRISIGLFMAQNNNISGVQGNLFGGTIAQSLKGVQASGFMNTATGSIHGVQGATFMNTANGTSRMKVIQASGFLNFANGNADFTGIQIAGFLNGVNGPFRGVQLAGFMNTAKENFSGIQGSAFLNCASANFRGVQLTGFLNISNTDFTGIQGTGYVNFVKGNFDGIQASGFLNVTTGTVKKAQVAIFLNVANEVDGVQVGIINIARKSSKASIGILNFIVDGIMSPAMYIDSNGSAFVQYQGGTDRFFTTLLAGSHIGSLDEYTEYGFGIGTRLRKTQKLSFDIELLSKSITNYMHDSDGNYHIAVCGNSVNKNIPSARATAQYSFYKHLSAFASFETEIEIPDYNENAFTFGKHNMTIDVSENHLKLHPVFAFGVKF